jgi:hypothetical protein
MWLHGLAAGFAVLMLVRHGSRALAFFRRGLDPAERRRALPSLLAVSMALALFLASLKLLART